MRTGSKGSWPSAVTRRTGQVAGARTGSRSSRSGPRRSSSGAGPTGRGERDGELGALLLGVPDARRAALRRQGGDRVQRPGDRQALLDGSSAPRRDDEPFRRPRSPRAETAGRALRAAVPGRRGRVRRMDDRRGGCATDLARAAARQEGRGGGRGMSPSSTRPTDRGTGAVRLQPRQGAVPAERLHQGPAHRLLRAHRRRDAPAPAERPLTMRRFPDGVDGKSFFEKHIPSHAPDWVRRSRCRRPTDTRRSPTRW